MTFNRYVAIRMAIELLGALSCGVQLLRGDGIVALGVSGAAALAWVACEVWVTMIFNRAHPRTDELSDRHQQDAFRFAFLMLVAVMCVVGFAAVIVMLVRRTGGIGAIGGIGDAGLHPMILPTLAMLALAVADARYLWLERDGAGGDDED